jgi:hypothetical protein
VFGEGTLGHDYARLMRSQSRLCNIARNNDLMAALDRRSKAGLIYT